MKLIKLSANKEGFKTVNFNPKGISLIVGQRFNENSQDKQSTYNSVGKSLIITLIHFCLGSKSIQDFEDKLNDWEFSLEFMIDDERFVARRACADPKTILLNDNAMSVAEYTSLLMSKTFLVSEKVKFLSFRSLISRFIRPYKGSYNSYDTYIPLETPYAQQLNNGFLLGLDPHLIDKKYKLKQELENTEQLKRKVPKDPIIKSFFDKDIESGAIQSVELKDKIDHLRANIEHYKIANDYYQVLKEADKLKFDKRRLELKATALRNAMAQIEKSLDWQPDIPSQAIISMYEEAKVHFSDLIKKSLSEVEEFNVSLIENRRKRLQSDRTNLYKELISIESSIERLGAQMEEKLQYLDGRGALEDYNKMITQLKDFEFKLHKLESYRKLLEEYKIKIEEIKQELSRQNIEALKFLHTHEEEMKLNLIIFRNVVHELYGEFKKSGIEISVDDGQSQNRFVIKAKIDDDSGDGVGSVKIFSFDWTLLRAKHNHKVKFLFHDSRLLSEIDSRQVSTLFELVHKATNDNDLQYIISSNQYILDSLKNEMDPIIFNKVIDESIVLRLTDESDNSRLLGMKIDLNYENAKQMAVPQEQE
ncbi:DUF2326 domain-containing protein [Tellurirhabdus rosea]|uniref:DUF2326 domain-containing protein n=1 Tax=Tellurirhabdus rosea TaxID=2674997 RepID=UPI00225368A4|nr:DUF2326 domain-containing protein [Tellurirhabdus rosea]